MFNRLSLLNRTIIICPYKTHKDVYRLIQSIAQDSPGSSYASLSRTSCGCHGSSPQGGIRGVSKVLFAQEVSYDNCGRVQSLLATARYKIS